MQQVREYVTTAKELLGNAFNLLVCDIGVPDDDWLRTRIDSHCNDLDDTIDDIILQQKSI
jgi:hypothetical protein